MTLTRNEKLNKKTDSAAKEAKYLLFTNYPTEDKAVNYI